MAERDDIAKALEMYRQDTADHELTVLRDEGIYRHLKMRSATRGSFYWFEIVTWPGCLTINGDMGTYTFSRVDDMFRFFRADDGRINPYYWGQKLRGPEDGSRSVKAFSVDVYREVVRTLRDDRLEQIDDPNERSAFMLAVRSQLLGYGPRWQLDYEDVPDSFEGAYTRLSEFEFRGHAFYDTWEHQFYGWSVHYLWALHAIVDTIARYDALKAGDAPEEVAHAA